jgi:predicted ATP-grasp superfamily ATP-dependent carboligase
MKDDGGAAFPSGGTELDHVEVNHDGSPKPIFKAIQGMSLRDYFAGQAIQNAPNNAFEFGPNAAWAYNVADAMLAERAKGE